MNKHKDMAKEQRKEKYSGRDEEMILNTPSDKLQSLKNAADEDSVF